MNIRQKDIAMTDALREYLDMKIVRPVEKLLTRAGPDDAAMLDIEMARTTRHHRKGQVYRMAAAISLGKKILRAEATDEDPRAACDILENELKREILTHKEKSRALTKRSARKAKRAARYAFAARTREGSRVREE